MTPELRKYPRTRHIEGSRLQQGDEDLEAVPFASLLGKHLVVEEKVDGANAAVSFTSTGGLLLQSRGHYLRGGAREKHFAPFKAWAASLQHELWPVLRDRYVVYGEWVFAKHTVYYDALPHYFLEFDVLDRQTGEFLSTPRRRALLQGLAVHSVPVLHEGQIDTLSALTRLIGPSNYKTAFWRERLQQVASGVPHAEPERVFRETDPSDAMEGLYVKDEEQGNVVGRYKFVRASFLAAVMDSESHWLSRPVVPNQLAAPAPRSEPNQEP